MRTTHGPALQTGRDGCEGGPLILETAFEGAHTILLCQWSGRGLLEASRQPFNVGCLVLSSENKLSLIILLPFCQ